MCHNPRVAYTAWEIRRRELVAEATLDRRVREARPPRAGRAIVTAEARRRLGTALIAVGIRVQGTLPATGLPDVEPAAGGA